MLAKPEHEASYQDVLGLLTRHPELTPEEMLAVMANALRKLIAMQDQRTMTTERAVKIIQSNIEAGNQQVIEALKK